MQAFARDQLHAEEIPPQVPADLVNRHDMRVVEPRHCLGLVLKSQELSLGSKAPRFDHLERDGPVKRDLVGFEDDAHPSSPQLTQNLIAAHHGCRRSTYCELVPEGCSLGWTFHNWRRHCRAAPIVSLTHARRDRVVPKSAKAASIWSVRSGNRRR